LLLGKGYFLGLPLFLGYYEEMFALEIYDTDTDGEGLINFDLGTISLVILGLFLDPFGLPLTSLELKEYH